MKAVKSVVAAMVSSLFAGSAMAAIEGNIGVTSEYMWRGMAQSSGAAVSGGLDWSNDEGWSAGIWTSNVNWGDSGNETDYYGGYSSSFGAIDYSITAAYYVYTGGSSVEGSDFGEILVDLSYSGVDFGFAYTPVADTDEYEGDLFAYVGYSFDLVNDIGASVSYGRYFSNDNDNPDGYSYYDASYLQLDITKGDFTWSAIKADDNGNEPSLSSVSDDVIFTVSWGTSF